MFGTLLLILLELAGIAGLLYVLKYTVVNRSGLNEPEKLQRIWSRSQEIRFQPVFKAMAFSIAVSYGAPAVLNFVLETFLVIMGLPVRYFKGASGFLSFFVLFISSAIGPVVYKASGGVKTSMNVTALLCFNMVMFYLLTFETVQDMVSRRPSQAGVFWISYLISPVILAGIQLPFALWGAARQFQDSAARIYAPTIVPDWVRLNKTIILASGPLVVTRLVALWIHMSVGNHGYLNRIASHGANMLVFVTCGLASVISVNRALLAEDFRWQWRSFLTPTVPLTICDTVIAVVFMLIKGTGHPITHLFILVSRFCSYGAAGALGAYAYLYIAEQYAQSQLVELDISREVGDEIFDEEDEDAQMRV